MNHFLLVSDPLPLFAAIKKQEHYILSCKHLIYFLFCPKWSQLKRVNASQTPSIPFFPTSGRYFPVNNTSLQSFSFCSQRGDFRWGLVVLSRDTKQNRTPGPARHFGDSLRVRLRLVSVVFAPCGGFNYSYQVSFIEWTPKLSGAGGQPVSNPISLQPLHLSLDLGEKMLVWSLPPFPHKNYRNPAYFTARFP